MKFKKCLKKKCSVCKNVLSLKKFIGSRGGDPLKSCDSCRKSKNIKKKIQKQSKAMIGLSVPVINLDIFELFKKWCIEDVDDDPYYENIISLSLKYSLLPF